jgi:hypothetical protein
VSEGGPGLRDRNDGEETTLNENAQKRLENENGEGEELQP